MTSPNMFFLWPLFLLVLFSGITLSEASLELTCGAEGEKSPHDLGSNSPHPTHSVGCYFLRNLHVNSEDVKGMVSGVPPLMYSLIYTPALSYL